MNQSTMSSVCVAEDDPSSRLLLESGLGAWGYSVILATNGHEALEILSKPDGPKLAILDWMMPGLSGPEVCVRLREVSLSEPIHIIMLTCKSEKADIVEGLTSGADDFIVKPYHLDELHARLRVGEKIVNLQKVLADTNELLARYAADMETLAEEKTRHAAEMEELARKKARQLVHAERLATLGILAAGVAHEINNPVSFIAGNMQILEEYCEFIKSSMGESDLSSNPKFLELTSEIPVISQSVLRGVSKIQKIVGTLKNYSRRDDTEKSIVDANLCVEQALEVCHHRLHYQITVTKQFGANLMFMGDAQQIEQVLVNLFINAADAMLEENGGGTLTITTTKEDNKVVILVEDDGPGLTKNVQDGLFQPFFTTKEIGKGTGLGLSISRNIVEDCGGTITAENRLAGGTRFKITLPLHF